MSLALLSLEIKRDFETLRDALCVNPFEILALLEMAFTIWRDSDASWL